MEIKQWVAVHADNGTPEGCYDITCGPRFVAENMSKADAEFIVLAHENYAALAAALQKCYWQLRGDADRADFMSDETAEVLRLAQAALSKLRA